MRQVFFDDFWGSPIDAPGAASHRSWRPLTVLSFRLDFALAGARPFPFHLHNALLHGLCAAAVAAVLLRWRAAGDDLAAHAAAFAFAAHPVHTEAVANITGRAEVLSALLCLVAFALHDVWCARWQQHSVPARLALGSGVAMAAVAAALCKEPGIAVAVVCAVRDVCSLLPTGSPRRWGACALRVVAMAAVAVFYFSLRLWVTGGQMTPHPDMCVFQNVHAMCWCAHTCRVCSHPHARVSAPLLPRGSLACPGTSTLCRMHPRAFDCGPLYSYKLATGCCWCSLCTCVRARTCVPFSAPPAAGAVACAQLSCDYSFNSIPLLTDGVADPRAAVVAVFMASALLL